ncbi:XamI family restriction endonuclease [Rhizobium leguminosarum]|uniref:XamI family restriction endonuclease n=1 Tax=Rhizobium leguminosarum TaxID=384 RepID=UPI0013BCA76A|nr:XamI family restriction endonuclease [Rhizobium leguminosarum]MBY5325400.1 XamI family restriction endonuclease [Rhizobium leguminosarum]MBY5381466.1 XamI family restriction endonuclease [Rhizobium leguminosarum]MCA2432837.1 XamI family restriction endonuclease [Rhizobium leguminosarum]NEH68645.1 XamI family restriction endonuclease [Rhizobium leguminosarum]
MARQIYMANRNPQAGADDWNEALRDARKVVAAALRASDYLRAPERALVRSGIHMMTFRYLLAPPVSQDQFALLCPSWPKRTEHQDRKMTSAGAEEAAAVVLQWLHRAAAPWLQAGRAPSRAELRGTLNRASFFIAAQRVQTIQRGRLSSTQEGAIVSLLEGLSWERRPSKLIDTRAAVDPRTFMHKTRFATKTTPQEVDIACGFSGTVVAAIECKVTNDETNSIKRINDVLKKASAWHDHWGSFVETVAILQGVIAAKDVDRLTDARVHVFWSHDLAAFRDWISARV